MTHGLDRIFQDGIVAVRTLRKSLGFTTVVLTVLALGIGATSAKLTADTYLRPSEPPETRRSASSPKIKTYNSWHPARPARGSLLTLLSKVAPAYLTFSPVVWCPGPPPIRI